MRAPRIHGLTALLLLSLMVLPVSPGWAKSAPKKRVTVVQEDGVWWFKDAEGKRFVSLGACCTGGCYGHWEDRPMDAGWRESIAGPMRKWGFNTMAAWSSPSLWEGFYIADQIYPPFAPRDFDVFNPKSWSGDLYRGLRQEMSAFLGRPNHIGYFIDNEPKWNGEPLFRRYRRMKPGSPGSRALLDFARSFYGNDLKALNKAWKTAFTSFNDITGKKGAAVVAERLPGDFLGGWANEVAFTYYRRYITWVRDIDPGCLILGERHSGMPDLAYIKKLAPLFDVIAINDYNRYGDLPASYERVYRETGKPLMITEWSFSGWPKPGYKSLQFIDVYTQENRAKGYRKYVLEAAKAPFMVGMHWFLWMDYGPWTGREGDVGNGAEEGEYWPDKNMGLVSSRDGKPYETLVAECARTNGEVEGVHARSAGYRPPEGAPVHALALAQAKPAVDGDLADWPAAAALVPVVDKSLLEGVTVDHRYWLAWGPEGLALAGDVSDASIDFPGVDWAWEGDYLGIELEFTSTATGYQSLYFQVYPTGGGDDGRQAYAASWWGRGNGEEVAVARKFRPGGFTMEALITPAAVRDLPLYPGAKLKVTLNYRNISEIYETNWTGDITLK